MAAKDVEHLKKHFLSCDICMDIYEDPLTLPCGHTFCRECYIRYCQENREATRRRRLQCPKCKQCSRVGNPGQMVDGSWNIADWVKPLKPTIMVRGLLDDFIHSDRNSEGTTVTRPGRRQSAMFNGKAFCQKHKLDFNCYCKKCKASVCAECVVENHMKCGDVVKIEAMKTEMKFTLNQNLQTLKQQTQQTKEWVGMIEHKMANLRKMESKVRADIKIITENAIKLIREWERNTLDELSSVTEKPLEQLRAQLKAVETDLQMFRQYSEFISRSLRDENEIDMIKMYEMCQSGKMFTKSEDGAHLASTQDFEELTFEKCFSDSYLKKQLHLGNLKVKKINDSPDDLDDKRFSELILTAVQLDTIDISHGDRYIACLVDVCVIEVDGVEVLLTTNFSNDDSCLKSFFIKDNKPSVTSLHLRAKPWCVTRLSSNKVAVSLPWVSEIVLVKLTPDLTLKSTIKTQMGYCGLTALDETTLAAGCRFPPCVDILDLRGRVKKTITPGGSLIQQPYFLSTTREGNILVSDRGSKSVVCLTPGGDVVFTYPPTEDRALDNPQGITTTTTGDILVVDSYNDKVIQLTGAGEYVRDLLTSKDGFYRPRGICVYKEKLNVTQFNIGTLRVFTLQ